jgi:hypothetical protein
MGVVFIPERDTLFIKCQQSMIGDGHPMRVAADAALTMRPESLPLFRSGGIPHGLLKPECAKHCTHMAVGMVIFRVKRAQQRLHHGFQGEIRYADVLGIHHRTRCRGIGAVILRANGPRAERDVSPVGI